MRIYGLVSKGISVADAFKLELMGLFIKSGMDFRRRLHCLQSRKGESNPIVSVLLELEMLCGARTSNAEPRITTRDLSGGCSLSTTFDLGVSNHRNASPLHNSKILKMQLPTY